MLRVLARTTAYACAVDRCSVFVRKGDVFVPAVSEFATGGSRPPLWQAFTALEAKVDTEAPAILTELLHARRPRLVSDLHQEPGVPDDWKQFGATAVLIVPLVRDDEVVGLLVLDTPASGIGPMQCRRARQLAHAIGLVLDSSAAATDAMRARIAQEAARTAVEHERMRVDRILHDGVRQTVFSMAMKIELAVIRSRRTSALGAVLRGLKHDAATLMAQVRDVVPSTSE